MWYAVEIAGLRLRSPGLKILLSHDASLGDLCPVTLLQLNPSHRKDGEKTVCLSFLQESWDINEINHLYNRILLGPTPAATPSMWHK